MNVKVVINSEFVGMNSGWPTRYIGLISGIYSRHSVTIFAPGDTLLLKEKFPAARVNENSGVGSRKIVGGGVALIKDLLMPKAHFLRFAEFPYCPALHDLIKKDTSFYDASIYFDMSSLVYYGINDQSRTVVCDFCDSRLRCLYNEMQKAKTLVDATSILYDIFYIRRVKKKFVPHSAKILAITDADRDCISTVLNKNIVKTLPNGIKLLDIEITESFLKKKFSSPNIIFLGSLDYQPNEYSILHSLKHLWPEIHRDFPHMTFQLVGRAPSARIHEAVKEADGVDLIGPVENIYDYYLNAKCFLGPIFSGAGMKNKFLESFNAGTPVVTTPEGAIGLSLAHGKQGFIGASDTDLLTGMRKILSSSFQEYSSYVKNCISLAENFSWKKICDQFELFLAS